METNVNREMKVLRAKYGWTQSDLAKKVGVSRQTILLIEKGEYNPSLNLCIAIAEALNSDLNTLFWRKRNGEAD